MQLSLEAITKTVGPSVHLYPMSLSPVPGAVTVLLGATQAGKTSLMRVMAGLDTASSGRVLVDGQDVTRQSVRERNVAMVYQQFVNYPSMTVAQNIASPLRLRGERGVEDRVRALAARLHIEPFLDRLPAELSGGQQQRVALARALAKQAPLMLLDEPLVNLDYKLREELREELTQLFASGDSTVVYATTEPGEALLLGGHTAVMDAGELLQYGPTAEVFHRPQSLRVARAFSDPPMNLMAARRNAHGGVRVADTVDWPLELPAQADDGFVLGIRAGGLRARSQPGDVSIASRVELAEIAGSDTFVHVSSDVGELVAQLVGVHKFELGARITLHLNPDHLFVFDARGPLVRAPQGVR
ncbi:MAG: ATP-binding cassette domain-containing protein [Hydrogenophaga sp.]|uniref:ABC transporter ATP-binding protein n=1 Tax=Hydrogenophaga sp. TaxID=1904254 RepID=UPI0016B2373D|nr:ABC transporter ATP-binding protein [Hydrogenophaga sp.]NIM43275.1 ATP-binding cassette domain-containing protein [Hydrogenophaga sp.]NIN28343.1 ATP-binding cassette domain-containing protein [Hydrogenophaga sp.]NIN29162.1 ATP-binding cassette domain-containing protein [Hydrogenophaga sp.]NIN57478.1 ATP-binding cassette domain-containing protein [Hydrogenophaga sp.]NIO53773.1 ATP-binding cassette domain-containing protein [Hydrogenophaga sp.]